MTVIGIDPGASGAIAVHTAGTDAVMTYPFPTLQIRGKKRIDVQALALMMDLLPDAAHAFVEDVHSMPKQGVASTFAFGLAAGYAQMAIAGRFIPLTLVQPAAWKRVLRVTADKDSSRQRASQLFPRCAGQWAQANQDGRAEAALIAYYGACLTGTHHAGANA